MNRIPVTKASYKKIEAAAPPPKGMNGLNVQVGKPDKNKTREAAYLGWGRFEGNFGRPSMIGASSTFYNNSYMAGGHNGGFGDVPPYIALLNECNGGVMYYPSTLKEKFEWYRYFYRFSPYVKAAVNLNTDLPMSRLQLRMPKMEDKERSKKIERFYNTMIDELHLFDKLHSMLLENNILGNCFPAGHNVLTPNGLLSIEQIREGDLVLTEKGTFEKVSHIMRRMASEYLYDIGINKEVSKGISPTGEHPIFVLDKDNKVICVHAKELKIGDYIELANCVDLKTISNTSGIKEINGRLFAIIESLEIRFFNGYVYNLEVENEHTYCVENICTHNCFLFIQYSEKKKRWDKITILPPEEISVANYPMSDNKLIQYRPEMLVSVLSKYEFPIDTYEHYLEYVESLPDKDKSILRDISYELVKQMKEEGNLLKFDSDPYHPASDDDKIGSFAYHFTEKRHEYQDWGVSPLECLLVPLLQQTHYQYTQLSLSSRNMTPRNIVTADGISEDALDDLRDQVDQSMLSPDYAVVTNFNIQWDQIGAENRLIDLSRENEVIENQLFAGLGVTREILTGEGLYSGNKISVEILNTKYLIIRERLQNFVEEYLFKPVALQNGFYEDDEDGNRTWFYPHLGFTRLTIRDNQEVFDQLFQLYQKGSLPIGMILDIFNINSDDVDEELKKDLFTVRDATFNEMLRQIYSGLGDKIVESTDLGKQVAESLVGPTGKKVKYTGEDADEEGGDEGMGDDEGMDLSGGGEEEPGGEEESGEESGEGESEEGEEPPEAPNGESEEGGFELEGEGSHEQEGENGAPEENEEQSELAEQGAVNEYLDKIRKQSKPEEGGNARSYLDNIVKNESGESNVKDYIRKTTEKGKAREYIEKSTKNDAREYIEKSIGGNDVREYLDQVLNEDKNVKKYLSNFLGDGGGPDDFSEDAQSAKL